ncbi:MAG: efflux RND transporter periplasmic adaptor subunit [Verrucomicrobiota bacterium]|nr:efflux RND transporter periplasmic adaptor subunit [Verrucomicrobiota bacterium]
MITTRMAKPVLAMAACVAACFGSCADPVRVDAITEPVKDITMAFPVIGVVGARPLEEGASVKRGQLVIELDKRLDELEVRRRKLACDLARIELDRLKSLAERNAISVSREEIDKKQAEYDIAVVELELAQETVRRRQLLSPIDGHVAEFYKDVGEKCEEQQPVVRLVDTRQCYCVANVEARLASKIKLESRFKVEIDAGAGVVSRMGTVSYISPIADPASGLLKIKLKFDNSDGAMRPGLAARLILSE